MTGFYKIGFMGYIQNGRDNDKPIRFSNELLDLLNEQHYNFGNINLDQKESLESGLIQSNEWNINKISLANNSLLNRNQKLLHTLKNIEKKFNAEIFGVGADFDQASHPVKITLSGEHNIQEVFVLTGLEHEGQPKNKIFRRKSLIVNQFDLNEMKNNIKSLRKEHPESIIIVYPLLQFKDSNSYERELFQLIDNGADYVFGTGNDKQLPIERNEKGTVIQSLGNIPSKAEEDPEDNYNLFVSLDFKENENGWEVSPQYVPLVQDKEINSVTIRTAKKDECRKLEESFEELEFDNDLFDYGFTATFFGGYFTKEHKVSTLKKFGLYPEKSSYKKLKYANLLNEIDFNFLREVQHYWKTNYDKKIDTRLHVAFHNMHGIKDVKIIPGDIMRKQLLEYFNLSREKNMYKDKNTYDKLISTDKVPATILKRVRNNYFDANNNYLSQEEAYEYLKQLKEDCIIKPSNTNNGISIEKLAVSEDKLEIKGKEISMKKIENIFGSNFIIQEIIKQHPEMKRPHAPSINTLRMVTMRWQGEIRYMLTFARFGANNSVNDNAGTGGVCVGVDDNGYLMDSAIDEHANVHTHHPTTGFNFSDDLRVPNFEACKEFVKELHKDILHHDYISWDIAISEQAEPIFIEANFSGATWIYQLASQRGCFGEITEDVLSHVREEFRKNIKTRSKKPGYFKKK
ncbi:sugar-transfer associated ATP-grasp domain-containing protein [Halalkalibacillus halophilus]|uniref:sugar-transfer associated ATP-grasp domain-containing protein n=1 Tax=Halalkalibacillus halophilus TaxID=392827 RepID=UPI000420AA17|nr:sugar-transfer associated ATP-grasp domain-containing protein [Halalkalibacillus halophilus]